MDVIDIIDLTRNKHVIYTQSYAVVLILFVAIVPTAETAVLENVMLAI